MSTTTNTTLNTNLNAETRAQEIQSYAYAVLRACRSTLLMEHHFLARAFFELTFDGNGSISFGTDGKKLLFRPEDLLRHYLDEAARVSDAFLHSVLHCLYLHPFFAENRNAAFWDLAADLCVGDLILSIREKPSADGADPERQRIIDFLKEELSFFSAQKIYAYLQQECPDGKLGQWTFETVETLFRQDEHSLWYGNAGESKNPENWKEIAENVEVALAAELSKRNHMQGSQPENLLLTLRNLTKENYDYSAFLRKFSTIEERMVISPDEFDYIYYCHGLELFGNVPLIEPLEYKEAHAIHDFAIALDTSGSCDESLIRRFLSRTYDILCGNDLFGETINVHIIQCDARVQNDIVITDKAAFEAYMEEITIYGRGGTDFRPVFEYVDDLQKNGAFTRLCGLLYFTDGYGTFPLKPPAYKTAFVFVDDGNVLSVPPWAMRVYVSGEDFEAIV